MPDIEFRGPLPGDLEHIAAHMRRADRAECEAMGETDLLRALEEGVRASVRCWVVEINGLPACVLGVVPAGTLLSDTGAPWLLGTDAVPRHARALMRHVPTYIDLMLGAFSHLLNYVHDENTVAVGWLKRMGFRVHPQPVLIPATGARFLKFERHRHVRSPSRPRSRHRHADGGGGLCPGRNGRVCL